MTLRLKRCVSLFVCLSLLVSACSPDKSSKTGNKVSSKANEFARNTEVEKVKMTEREKEARKVATLPPSFCDKHKWCSVPRDTWGTITSDREIGKVGGLSITPKRVAIGTVAVFGIVAVGSGIWWLGHKKRVNKPLTLEQQQVYEKHKRQEEDLKKNDLSIERLEEIQEELRLEAVELELEPKPNKKRLGQMTKQTGLLNSRLLERRYELSPKALDQLLQELPELKAQEEEASAQVAKLKAQAYIMDMEWEWDKMKCAKKINDILDSSSHEQVESLRLNMGADELRELELQTKERNLLKRQPPHHLPITSLDVSPLTVVPQPRLSSPSFSSVYTISTEEKLMLKKMKAEQRDLMMRLDHARGMGVVRDGMMIREQIAIKFWSTKVTQIFDVVAVRVDDEMKTKPLTYALAKTVVEPMLKEQLEEWDEYAEQHAMLEALARKAERTLPLSIAGLARQLVSTKIKLTTLSTLRRVGALWDEKRIRLEPQSHARRLTINEKVALDTIMAMIKERALNYEMVSVMYDIIDEDVPHNLRVSIP